MGWRLSLGHSFIVLVSQYVSSDGLVGWKSNRLGANFYTPNVFAKEVSELSNKMWDTDAGKCKYPIDVIIISGISIGQFAEKCRALSKFANPNTVVLVNASFGCELEEVALNMFEKNCKCVMSIACDVECRQLSLGSYALVNNDNCKVYLGLTYSSQNDSDGALLSNNEAKVREELGSNTESNTNRFLAQLTVTQWIKVQPFLNPQEMAIKIWELIIPKISLNILSVIYEQFDYDALLKNKSNEIMFKDLVKELFDICYAQCRAKVEKFMTNDANDGKNSHGGTIIDYSRIVDYCKAKKRELVKTTANEYPEYLSLSFESYCFYHRFEYPAHILLYQPILLAKRYDAPCSNLNFLYGFYSRLLSLSGLSIYGGRSESHMSVFDKRVAEASSTAAKSSKKSKKAKKGSKTRRSKHSKKIHGGELVKAEKSHPLWAKCRSNNEQGLWTIASPSGNELLLPDELGNLYLAAENMSGYPRSAGFSRSATYEIGDPKSADSDDHYSTAESNNEAALDGKDERVRGRGYRKESSHSNDSCNGRLIRSRGYLEGSDGSIDDSSEDSEDDDTETEHEGDDSEGCCESDDEKSDNDSATASSQILMMPRKSAKRGSKQRNLRTSSREGSFGALEDMGVVGVPHFIKRFSSKTPNNSSTSLVSSIDSKRSTHLKLDRALKRPYTTESLELQLRRGDHLIAKEYDDLHRQLSSATVNPEQARMANDQRRRTFASIEKEMWKLQRRHNVYNKNISRPKTSPYEDLLEHMDVMRRSNANDILDFTTSRYGDAESCTIMQNDRKQIMSLYEGKLRGKRGAKAITRPTKSSTTVSRIDADNV